MAYWILWVFLAFVWAVGLYSAYQQTSELIRVLRFQKQFKTDHTDAKKRQTSMGILFLCIFMCVLGLILGFTETDWQGRCIFWGTALLFLSLSEKNWMLGHILWTKKDFVWKDEAHSFQSVRNFDTVHRQSIISFMKGKDIAVPSSAALFIQSLKAMKPAER